MQSHAGSLHTVTLCVTVLAAQEETVLFVGAEPQAVSQRWGRDAQVLHMHQFL